MGMCHHATWQTDCWSDDRRNWERNEVALDYNAPVPGLLAWALLRTSSSATGGPSGEGEQRAVGMPTAAGGSGGAARAGLVAGAGEAEAASFSHGLEWRQS